MRYWLIKSEGDCYPIAALKHDKITPWTGVRNFQARNFMRDDMKKGDRVLFYHSNGTKDAPSGVYGTAVVVSLPYPDPTQFDKSDDHYDPKSKKENPTWILVDMKFSSAYKHPVTLSELKAEPRLEGMMVRERGSRLSIQPVSKEHFVIVESLGK